MIPGQALASFVPTLLARRLATRADLPQETTSERCDVAVLGVDISESTAMTEDLTRRDAGGTERVAGALNAAFALLGDAIVASGGSVISLAGDEMVGLWDAREAGGLDAATRGAAAAALAITDGARSLPQVGGYALRMRTGVGAGTAYLLDIGREHGRRLFVAAGPALQEMAAAQHAVEPSEIGLGPTARPLLEPHAAIDTARRAAPRLLGLDTAAAGSGPPGPGGGAAVPDALAARYVPDSVFHRLRSGAGQLQSELSPVTVVFVMLRTGPWSSETSVHVGEASLQVLATLASYGGTLVSARQDLDGVTLVAGFGLPPVVREHEAARAGLCALEISNALKGYMEHGIGIATGRAFCGVFGSPAYRQYTVIGPIVNLGARLMQQAQNEALCDDVTQHLSRGRLRFSARGPITAKGFRVPVDAYRPEWHETDQGLPALKRLALGSREATTRGREREQQELAGRLVALSLGTSTAVVVEGDPGAGKTHVAMDLLEASDGYGRILTLAGSGDEMDRGPYHAWKPVLSRALGLAGVRDAGERAAAVLERLGKWPEVRDWAPLLCDILDLRLDDASVRDMSGATRRENTLRLLVQLLADAAEGVPLLVVLDDCHWMDSASWELVRAVHRDVSPLMVALFTRPLGRGGPQTPDVALDGDAAAEEGAARTAVEVEGYLRASGALWLHLGPLAPDVTEQIARDFLAVDALDAPLRPLFREKVGGSPLFTVEMAFQLRADELIAVEQTEAGPRGRLAVPATDLARLELPVRVEEVFRARLSGLSERQRAVIRAASVVGTSFDTERVLAADPELEAEAVAGDLGALERLKVVESAGGDWRFQHALIRDVAGQSMPPSELRQRHRMLAEWYEQHRLEPETYAIIARHWEVADEPARRIEYLEAGGTSALMRGAEDEAIALTRAALAADAGAGGELDTVTDARRAFWHTQVGEALAARNRLAEGVASYRAALHLLGRRVPRTRLGWAGRLAWEVARQLVHLLPLVSARVGRHGDRPALAQAAGVFSVLAEAQYFRNDSLAWTACNLASVNLAEAAGDVGLAGRAYSGLGNLAGTVRLHRLARRYFRRARQEVTGQQHGTDSPLTLGAMPDVAWEHDITATLSEAVYLRTMNRATDVLGMFDDVIARLREAGLNQPLEIALAIRGFMHSVAGALRSARVDFEELVLSARRRANADHLTWGLTLLVPVLLALDREAEALRLDEEATRVFSEADRLSRPNFHGSHTQALLARGAADEALRHATEATRALRGAPVFFHLTGLTAMAEACLDLLRAAGGTPSRRAAERVTRRALKALRRYVRVYPFARARYDLHAGAYLAWRGRDRAARRRWSRGVRAAEDAGLALDASRMRLHLAERLPADSPERADHLRRARHALLDLGLGHYLDSRFDQLV